MPTISTLTAVLNLDQSGFRSGVQDAQNDMEGLRGQAQKTGKKLTSAGKTMTMGITAPLMAMGALSARTAASFDQNMQKSIAVMGSVSDTMREDLEQTARDVANTTTMSADQAAQSYYYLASAGLDAQQAMAAMPQVAAFAEAGQMDMAEATDTATNVMSAYGLEAEEMSKVTDVMTATVTNHNQTMQGMSAAFKNAAPAAASMGVEIEELAALTGALGDVGIQAEEAGTALNSIMRRMAKRSGEAGQALDKLGIQTTDANGELLPMIEIVEQLEDANMSSAEASAIFGRQMSAGQALVEQGAGSLRDYKSNLEDSEGATKSVAETQRDTLNAEMQIAKSNIKDVGITIGAQLLPMISALTGQVKGAAQEFQGLSDGQQKAILLAAGLAAALGPVLMMAGLMAQSVVALSGAYGVLTGMSLGLSGSLTGALLPSTVAAQGGLLGMAAAALAANIALGPITIPLWALVAAIAALVAGVAAFAVAYQKNWKGVKDYTEWAIDPIVSGIDWFIEKIFGISDATGKVAGAFGDFVDWVIKMINKIPGISVDDDGLSVGFETDTSLESGEGMPDMSGEELPESAKNLPDDWNEQGQQAGQNFGSGFQSGVVEGLKTDDIESHLENQLAELEERKSNVYGDEYMEAREEAQKVEEQLAQVREAENIGDVETDIVAEVARSELESEEERAKQIEDVYSQLEGEGYDVNADSGSGGPSMSPEDVDEQSVEAMLAESEDSSGSESQLATKLDALLDKHDQLRATVETLQLIVEMDLNSREFNKIIDDRAEAKAKEIINGTGP